jgi:hypothetical protein
VGARSTWLAVTPSIVTVTVLAREHECATRSVPSGVSWLQAEASSPRHATATATDRFGFLMTPSSYRGSAGVRIVGGDEPGP